MSGSTIGGFAGAAIGFWFGGPEGARWGFMIGSAVGGYVDPAQIEGPRLTDAQTQTSNEGVPRPIIYGTAAVAGNIIQCGPLVEHKTTQRAGKGGPVQETYTYTRDVAIRICEAAPLGGTMVLRRVWKNDKLVADWSEANTIPADTAAFESILTFYSGDEDQLPDPTLEALPTENGGGVGNVPAYRGTCYAVLTGLDVTESGGAVPQFRWEVCSDATETTSGIEIAHANTGNAQRVYSADISDTGVCMVAGENDNLRRSEGIAAWAGVSYGTSLGWPVSWAITNIWWDQGSTWYMATGSYIAKSTDDGKTWASHSTALYGLSESSVGRVSGAMWAGVQGYVPGHGTNTCIFQPLVGSDTVVDLGMDAGFPSTIAEINNIRYVGTKVGYILRGTTMVYRPTADPVKRFAVIGNTIIAACGSLYSYSLSNGEPGSWVASASLQMRDICVWNGVFYATDSVAIYKSTTGLPGSWTSIDSYFSDNVSARALIQADVGGFFAVTGGGGGIGPDDGKIAGFVPAGGGIALPDTPGHWLLPDGTISGITTTTVTAGAVPLSSIVADICDRDGVGADQVDVTALAGISVRGFPIARQTSAAEAIRALQQVYFFDFPEWGNSGELGTKLRAVLRGGAVAVTITDDDLVDNDDDEDTRAQQVEFPRKVNLTASDPDSNYEPITQPAERSTENVKAVGEASFSTNVVMTRDECAVVVDKLLKMLWEQANGRTELELPEEFTVYTSSDRASYKGKEWLIERTDTLDGSVRWKLTRDRASAYGSTATGSTALTPTPPVSSIRGPTMGAFMNLPRLRSQDTTPGMYVAVCGLLPGWAGCDLYLSVDGGVSEQKVATILEPATMGVLTAGLAAAGTPLSVRLYDGELDSVTVDQLLARLNAAAVTTDEVSEILQFQTATETAADEYDLTDLTRGELYTAADDHVTGDSFVLLDAAVVFVPLDIGLAGKVLIFRPVSIGTAPANNTTYEVTFRPQFTGPQVVEAYTDDAGNVYTDDADNTYYYEVPPT